MNNKICGIYGYYNGYRLPIGGFCDFVTCDILNIFISKNKK